MPGPTLTPAYQQVLENRLEETNRQLQDWPASVRGRVSDGFHTFDELYAHRVWLFTMLAMRCYERPVWRSRVDDEWFLAGIDEEPGKQISYHLPMSLWQEWDFAHLTLDVPPPFDGHTSQDVLDRLAKL